MQERQFNREQYFKEQEITTKQYVIPFINETIEVNENISVLEIGCGEGGNLKPFLDLNCQRVVGIDLSSFKINIANNFFHNHPHKQHLEFIHADIYDITDIGQFDLIIMRDTLEHIHDQERFMAIVKRFLKPGGKLFIGFPPWHNPFGGHQQMCTSTILSKMPYFHILPSSMYRLILKMFGENDDTIKELLEVKETRITIERFEKIIRQKGYHIDKRTFYFINPNYEVKFNLKPRKQILFISSIPYLRNFFITTIYYVISVKNASPNSNEV